MLTKGQMNKYADVLLWGLKTSREGRYKKGDIVMLHFELQAIRLAEVLQGKLLDMGMNPVLRLGMTPIMEQSFFEKADSRQLVFTAPGQKELLNNINGSIHLRAPDSLTHLRYIDSRKIGKTLVSQKPLRDILRRREEKGAYGWTLCMLPTEELAKQANLSLKQYSNQIIRACYLDKADPVQLWQTLYNDAIKIKKWLNSMDVKHYHIESKSVDLKVTPGKYRKWIGLSGHNIPSFEIFTSPDWRGTEGVYYADQPSFRSGNYVEDVKLTFKKGSVIKIEAKKGGDFVKKTAGHG